MKLTFRHVIAAIILVSSFVASVAAVGHTDKIDVGRIQFVANATQTSVSNAELHAQRALTLFNRGAYRDAIEEYSMAIVLAPTNAMLFHNRGLAAFRLGRYDASYDDFSKGITLEPGNAWLYNGRGGVSLVRQNFSAAAADFSKAISLDPRNTTFNENLKRARAAMQTATTPAVRAAPLSKCDEILYQYAPTYNQAPATSRADLNNVIVNAAMLVNSGDVTQRAIGRAFFTMLEANGCSRR